MEPCRHLHSLNHLYDDGSTESDAEVAQRLFQAELRELTYNDLPNRQLGEDIEDQQNDDEEAFEAAAFGWKLKQWEGHVEVGVPSPRDQNVQKRPTVDTDVDLHSTSRSLSRRSS